MILCVIGRKSKGCESLHKVTSMTTSSEQVLNIGQCFHVSDIPSVLFSVRLFGGLYLSMPCSMCLLRYSCIAPLILPACAAYFAMASVVYRFLQQQFSAMDS